MIYKSRGPGPPASNQSYNLIYTVFSLAIVFNVLRTISAEPNKYFQMNALCQKQFMSGVYQQIDGAVVTSKNERNLDCVITFQTLSILQRFMLRFDKLRIDCNDHLFIYDVANPVGQHRADLTCRNTTDTFGVMFTGSNYLTLRYITDAWGTEVNGFELLITAFKNQTAIQQQCFDFKCTYKGYCISHDLICDGLNHCLDGSDETLPCSNKNSVLLLGINLPTVVIIGVSSGLILIILCVTFAICVCRGRRNVTPRHIVSNLGTSTLNFPLENSYNANGTNLGGLHETTIMSCNNIGHKMPGNWGHPAGLKLGYCEVRGRLYCQAK